MPAARIPDERKKSEWQRWLSTGMLFICLSFLAVLFKAFLDGQFHSIDTLRAYVSSFGLLAPLILVGIQAAQVVVPVLPGFLGCAVGAILFGCTGGFLCNYIGICVGSILSFLIAKKYGVGLVKSIFPAKVYEKWSSWAGRSKCFTVTLFLVMVLPLFPDDFFCYFSGVTKMSTKKFVGIILLGKPWCILAYSLLFAGIL
ncbi:MAG: TVP38/TMEM64 family protein [Lachnospiraceae bacterium]|nr:TVP38/TMEM64 family protein [Lachnospiraceae bacterium]